MGIMRFFDRIFRYIKSQVKIEKKNPEDSDIAVPQNENVVRLLELKSFLDSLLNADKYVAKSEYIEKIKEYDSVINFFTVLSSSGMLDSFCSINGGSFHDIQHIMESYANIEKLVDQHNEDYIARAIIREKDYLDHILKAVDPVISLDEDQRRVVLTDEDYCLVIAGAGAGKTTTVAAKVKYLVDRQGIKPSQILVISFTNKAVNELKEKIQRALGIDCPIATFHSTGNAVIHVNSPDEKLNIVDNSRLYFVIRDYFRGSILQNESIVNKLIMFFASYFDAPYEGDDLNGFFNNIAKANYSTMRSDLEDFKREVIDARTKKSVTIQNEVLRSHQEVEIANFLYLNNIDYEYEPVYKYDILYARKPYTPDFIVCQDGKSAYIEHFGISENGDNDRYGQEELDRYKKAVNDKVRLHRKHGTTLIYTFSDYNDKKPLLTHLRDELEKKGFELRPRSNKEVMEMLVAGEENRYVRKLINLICRFISNFKVNGYTTDEFNRMYHSTQNVRSRLFLDICNDCYLEYEGWLKENKAVDFEDMINESARILNEVKEMKQKLDFKYIIVDEYQDISRQRFDLTKALAEVTDAKIIAVGDDWQSIYAFSGSDIKIEDDPVLSLVIKGDRSIDYAEERRLFYVAMTRTKNRVFFIAPEQNPSEFLLELKRDYKNVILHGDWNEEVSSKPKKVCPLCGYPMQLKYKRSYGLRLYICTNEPEICSFMTNDLRAGKMSIQKCDKCRDGYLIVKPGKCSEFFLGCTNYKANGTGCSKTISKKHFYEQMGYEMETVSDQSEMKSVNRPVTGQSVSPQQTSALEEKSKENGNEKKYIVSRELKDDYVEIIRADVKPVIYGKYDLNDILFIVVKALQNVSQVRFYGITMLTDILKGTDTKRIFENKLDKLTEFGALCDMPRETIRAIIEWMIEEHLILKTKERYPVLHSTYEGLHYSEFITEGKIKKLKKYLEAILSGEAAQDV